MDRILIGAVFCALLVSCNGNGTNTESNHADNHSNMDNKKVVQLAGKLHGEWISDTYLKNIEAKKSIYLSREYDTKMMGFHLKKENLLTDSAFFNGFTEHEGTGDFPIKYDEASNRFVNDMARLPEDYPSFPDPFELNYDGDKILAMYFPKSKRTDRYRKVDADFQTEVRKILIAGDYKAIDGNSKISLASDGKVDGFYDFKYYKLVHDFVEGIAFDAILFFRSTEGGNWSDAEIYKFEVVPNALRLQYAKPDEDNWEYELDDSILVLERQ